MQPGLPRVCEVILASAGLGVCLPLLALIAMAVGLSSKGPIIFRQRRVGLDGRVFKLYKFRTMCLSADGPQVTASDDTRVTRVGRFLRRFKLDELPELWNVIKGDMSLVGPRPEVERYVDRKNPRWKSVLRVRPGITDPITMQLRNEEQLLAEVGGDRERFYLDVLQPFKLNGYLYYLQRRSWRSDLIVLYRTMSAVVLPHRVSAPDIDQNQ